MASSSLNTAYLVLTGVVVVAITLVFAVFQPMLAQTQSVREEIAAAQVKLAERENFLRTLDQKVAALARESQHEQQLNVVLPLQEESEDVLRVIHQAERASGGTVRRINNVSAGVQSAANAQQARGQGNRLPENITPLGFELDFGGSYQQLRVFLNEIQISPRLMDVTGLEIRRSAQVPDTITATLNMQFYRYGSIKK